MQASRSITSPLWATESDGACTIWHVRDSFVLSWKEAKLVPNAAIKGGSSRSVNSEQLFASFWELH